MRPAKSSFGCAPVACSQERAALTDAAAEESPMQQERRNTYFIPIERLTHQRELFAKLQTLRYAFAAHFGEVATEPFKAISGARNDIQSAASVLIQITRGDDPSGSFERDVPQLLDTLGWGITHRPDDIDLKIEKAVQDIEKLCRPVLSVTTGVAVTPA